MQTDTESKRCHACHVVYVYSAYAPYKYCPYCGARQGAGGTQ